MNLSLDTQTRGARVGNLYGWAVGFLTEGSVGETASLLLTSNDYYASIEAVLPSGLTGGRVQIVIDALTDAHYQAIRTKGAADLFLFWQDVNTNFLGNFSNISGLAGFAGGPSIEDLAPAIVTRFAFTMKRRPGKRGYETVIEGSDNSIRRLSRIQAPLRCYPSLVEALAALGQTASVTITPEPNGASMMGQVLTPEDEQTDASAANRSCADALDSIARRIAAGSQANPEIPALRSDAPSVVLVRDGVVHVGRRNIPFPAGTEAKTVDSTNGLVDAVREGEAGKNVQVRWSLLCRGRPDLKPGDVVRFRSPLEDVESTLPNAAMALVGSLVGPILGGASETPNTTILITDIAHRQSRTVGFTTAVGGLQLPESLPFEPWALFYAADGLIPTRTAPGGDAATAIGRQVRNVAQAALGRVRLPEVAEVRSSVSKTSSPPEPPAQTVTVWEGTGQDTGQANPSRRLRIERTHPIERRGVATVTPFAWGECGLAVPRYPGMRVILGFGRGRAEDPLDVGALWGAGARMQSEVGDWWLKLPVNQSTAALNDTAEHLPTGDAVNDLTNAAGIRVIEAGKLTIRVGTPLGKISARPQHKASQTVSIEHADGKASITIDQDGIITMTGKTITLDAPGGTVSINAKDVNVAVSNQMKVS